MTQLLGKSFLYKIDFVEIVLGGRMRYFDILVLTLLISIAQPSWAVTLSSCTAFQSDTVAKSNQMAACTTPQSGLAYAGSYWANTYSILVGPGNQPVKLQSFQKSTLMQSQSQQSDSCSNLSQVTAPNGTDVGTEWNQCCSDALNNYTSSCSSLNISAAAGYLNLGKKASCGQTVFTSNQTACAMSASRSSGSRVNASSMQLAPPPSPSAGQASSAGGPGSAGGGAGSPSNRHYNSTH